MTNKLLLTAMALTLSVMGVSAQYKYDWQNPQLPRAERVESLLGMLTPEKKVGLMMH